MKEFEKMMRESEGSPMTENNSRVKKAPATFFFGPLAPDSPVDETPESKALYDAGRKMLLLGMGFPRLMQPRVSVSGALGQLKQMMNDKIRAMSDSALCALVEEMEACFQPDALTGGVDALLWPDKNEDRIVFVIPCEDRMELLYSAMLDEVGRRYDRLVGGAVMPEQEHMELPAEFTLIVDPWVTGSEDEEGPGPESMYGAGYRRRTTDPESP